MKEFIVAIALILASVLLPATVGLLWGEFFYDQARNLYVVVLCIALAHYWVSEHE
jgi:hypothetical protein